MNTYIFVVLTYLFSNEVDTIVIKSDLLIINNEKSCFTCIKPFAEYFESHSSSFVFFNIAKNEYSTDNFPLSLKKYPKNIFCKNEIEIFYFNGLIISDSLTFNINDRILPLIISHDNNGLKTMTFESICTSFNCNSRMIKRKIDKYFPHR